MAEERFQGGLDQKADDLLTRLIHQRRSIRSYRDTPLSEACVKQLLSSAHQAPSPSNSQPVRYVRIDSQCYREKIRSAFESGHAHYISQHKATGGSARLRNWINAYRRYSEFMFDAPVLMAVGVSTTTTGFAKRLAEAGLLERKMRQSCDLDITVGLALNGMMLKAQALGVGSCILTAPLVFIDDVEELLDLKEIQIKCFVTLGMADETPQPTSRVPLEEVYTVI